MPVRYLISSDYNCVFMEYIGTFRFDEGIEGFERLFKDPKYQQSMNICWDLRPSTIPVELVYPEIRTEGRIAASQIDEKLSHCLFAMIAKNGSDYAKVHQFIVALRFENSPVERKAFRDFGQALKWINVPENYEINFPSLD